MNDIDDSNLEQIASFELNDFLNCDFTEEDGSDPNGVDDFIHNKAGLYKENNLCVIYTVKYTNKVCGFFTLSMAGLEIKRLIDGDKISDVSQLRSYPALLLGFMGVDKKFRCKKIGSWICKHCIGFAVGLSTKIGCGYVVLQTNTANRGFYEKFDFITSGEERGGKIWMYRRIFRRIHRIQIHESITLSESVTAKVIRSNHAAKP